MATVRPESGEGTFKALGQNLISSACPSPVPNLPVLAHLHSKSAATVLPITLNSREHKTPSQALSETDKPSELIYKIRIILSLTVHCFTLLNNLLHKDFFSNIVWMLCTLKKKYVKNVDNV